MTLNPPFPHRFEDSRYSTFYLLNCVPESAVQAAILESLQWRGIPAVAVDAGAAKLRGRAYRALKAAGQNARGILAGQTGADVVASDVNNLLRWLDRTAEITGGV